MNLLEAKHHGKRIVSASVIGIAIAVGLFASILAGLGAAAYGYELVFRDKMFPGVRIAGLKLDGMTRAQAEAALQKRIDAALEPGFIFRLEDRQITLPRSTVPIEDPDLSRDLVSYDPAPAVDLAFQAGRDSSPIWNVVNRVRLYMQPLDIDLKTIFNRDLAENLLHEEVGDSLPLMRDAELHVRITTSTESGFVSDIQAEQVGKSADIRSAITTLEAQARRISFQPITIRILNVLPTLTVSEIRSVLPGIPAWIAKAPFTLTNELKKQTVTSSTIAGWITASSTPSGAVLALDPERIEKSMATFTADYLKEPRDGKLTLDEDGKLKEFVAPIEGVRVDGRLTGEGILAAWSAGSSSVPIVFARISPKIEGADAERLGIRELLGVGRSYFDGSPSNRRKNIALGAKKMNGVLVAPGEIFSQLGVLGEIDGPHGWYQELVIKGNKTTPEYGGGLCQVGSTSFRMAMASGMPIVERRNHSYRVRYYEPAGTDATIYSPSPDFRFKNDTSSTILLTSELKGDMLAFYMWGTKDGRVAEQTKPRIYNIVAAPPLKLIPTTELPIGKRKCTESAHAGATASLDYTITYASGEQKKETFTSYYRPWGAVCLIGASPEEVAASQNPAAPVVDETGINNPN
ncbi:VanW family protein [Candidatus Uhrbacteria bacterium]|nr:VanW family protein [Candidatus Uhrbacteria bacterium]